MIIPDLWKNKKCSKPPTRHFSGFKSPMEFFEPSSDIPIFLGASSCSGPGAFRDGWPGNRVRKGATLMTERLQQVWVYRFKKEKNISVGWSFTRVVNDDFCWMNVFQLTCGDWKCVWLKSSLLQYQFNHFMGATPYDYIHPLDLIWNPPKLADMAIGCKSTVRQKLGHRAGWELEDF